MLIRSVARHVLLAACMFAIPWSTAGEAPSVIVLKSKVGDVHFDHQRHAALAGVGCTDCHHAGTEIRAGDCHACHRPDSKFPRRTERAFHDSCIGCHDRVHVMGKASGPIKRCSECHRAAGQSKRDQPG